MTLSEYIITPVYKQLSSSFWPRVSAALRLVILFLVLPLPATFKPCFIVGMDRKGRSLGKHLSRSKYIGYGYSVRWLQFAFVELLPAMIPSVD